MQRTSAGALAASAPGAGAGTGAPGPSRRSQAATAEAGGAPSKTTSKKSMWKYCYNKQKGTCCDRTAGSWGAIAAYSIIYLVFLMTFTMMLLYISLIIIKSRFQPTMLKAQLYTYTEQGGIGLTVSPMIHLKYPLIWYKSKDVNLYQKYVDSISDLLSAYNYHNATKEINETDNKRKFPISSLGECGRPPYGYGTLRPCFYFRVNRQIGWNGRPMTRQSPFIAEAPPKIKEFVEKYQPKLWMHCDGYYPWDRQHIGNMKYYPDPPGLDTSYFPYKFTGGDQSPLIALQISNFSLDVTIAVQCRLWHELGSSSCAEFSLYVGRTGNLA